MKIAHALRCIVFLIPLIHAQIAASQSAYLDINSDGTADYAVASFGLDLENPITGSVTLYDGASSEILYQLTTDEPNDGFGFVVEPLADIDFDGIPDLIVTAPRAGVGTGPVGKAFVYSGVDGELLYTIQGANGDRFGMAVSTPVEYLNDGTPLLVVAGMALDLQGTPVDRTHWFDASTGELLSRRSDPIEGLVPVITPDGFVWGDIDQDEDADTTDVILLMNEVNTGGEPDGGDLNGDQTVDAADVGVLASAIGGGGSGGGPVGPATDPIAADHWQALNDAMSLWAFLYPEDPISYSMGEPPVSAAVIPDWWFGNGFHVRDDILGNSWFDSNGDAGCSTGTKTSRSSHSQTTSRFSPTTSIPPLTAAHSTRGTSEPSTR